MKNLSILFVTRNLPPLIGGMERLNWHIIDELSKIYHVSVISHTQAKTFCPKNIKFYSVKLSPLILFLIICFFRTLYLCIFKRPNILFAGSGLTAPIVVILAKIFKLKSIVYLHGLDIGTKNIFYNLFWIPCIQRANQIIANSSLTYELCIQKKVPKKNLNIIHPGVTYPPLPQDNENIHNLKKKYNLFDKKILISVGRLTQRKGLNEFIEFSFHHIVKKFPNIVLIIVGDTPLYSLNQNIQSQELILTTAEKHNVKDNIIFTGNITDNNILSSLYYLADIHVFPVKHILDDPEGFGMVAIEAAAHGTPTLGFSTGGIVDAVKEDVSGYLIPNEDYELLTESIIHILENSYIKSQNCQKFAQNFSWSQLANKFKAVIHQFGGNLHD